MSSWDLLRHLFGSWRVTDNAIVSQAMRHPPIWHGVYVRLARATGALLVAGSMACYGVTLALVLLHNLLVLFVPVHVAWTMILGLTLGPVVAGERQRGTWVLVRVTPLPLAELVLGRMGGALWWLRDLIRALTGGLLLVAVGIGMVTLVVTPTGGDNLTASPLPGSVLCLGAFVVPVISAAIYIVERAQHFVLMVTAALTVSASTRTVRSALTGATTATLSIWLLDVAIAGGVIVAQPDYRMLAAGEWLALLTLGPLVGYLAALPLERALLLAGATLLIREVMIRALWRVVLHRAAEP